MTQSRTNLRRLVLGALAAAALSLSSCSRVGAYIDVALGNAAVKRGRLQQATVDYLEAGKSGAHQDLNGYDLGNGYHGVGEA